MDLTELRFHIYSQFWKIVDNIFPLICLGCEKKGEYLCEECKQEISTIKYHYPENDCRNVNSQERSPNEGGDLQPIKIKALAFHDGAMKEAVHRLKYDRDLGLGKLLGKMLVPIVQKHKWEIDLIAPVPLGRKRRKERGYNQAEVIAFPLAYHLKKEFDASIIIRCRETRTQIGLTVKERYENMEGAFVVKNGKVKGKSILLVDDVYTSGATMKSAVNALKEAGAKCVYSLTVTKANNFSTHEIW